ncbi:peptidoglycan editing factor PgeF [Ornithinibacillus bavariensis]|uniref:peptidoglycan editing factor PgeF n=1 Tax=Ornithinibacillus bavariensis TaxID=545502 RepID=UPI000EBAE2E3|nr:peptidoglycan editing factor PgeF [Ornithinibacillus sp.]
MEDIFEYDGKSLLHIRKWSDMAPALQVGFTSRNGGVSKAQFESNNFGLHVSDQYEDVLTNRLNLASSLHIPVENWIAAEQVHQGAVHVVDKEDAGKGSTSLDTALKGIDGLITNEKGLLCTAFFADCVPIFFFDSKTGYVGIAHAGWKGTVARIAEVMTNKLVDLGVDLKSLFVAVGPCISKDNYEVDSYVKERIPVEFQDKVLTPVGNENYLLDLKQLNVEILVQSGVFRNNIDVSKYCTFRDEDLFFSHRRDNGKTGRMLGYIGYSK